MEAVQMTDQRMTSVYCLLAGFGLGLGVAILIAPRSGAATRKLIQEKAEAAGNFVKTKTSETNEYVKRRAAEALDQTNCLLERSKEVVNKQKDLFANAVEAGKQAYRAATEKTATA
jgi:gas vesicle protein